MTDRLVILPLTWAGDKYCEHCNRLGVGRCAAFDRHLGIAGVPRRIPECTNAERAATRLLAVEATALALVDAKKAWLDAGDHDGQDAAEVRLSGAWDALRAALKES